MLPGLSVSSADLAFSSYGFGSHYDQYNEWLGASGSAYDGLTWSPFLPGQSATLSLEVNVGDFWGVGDWEYLSVWIDWDQNRVFDADEEILDLDDYWFDYGINVVTHSFIVPTDAVMGSTWMRARLTFDSDLAATDALMGGSPFTGEIEDYSVDLIPEPVSLTLMGFGLAVLAGGRIGRARKRTKDR
jgi:hypothetical protein